MRCRKSFGVLPPKELIQRFRFGRDIIQNILLPLVYPRDVATTNRGLPIPPIIKLCTALRFYASGSYQRICGDLAHISQTSTCRIINEVSELLARNIGKYVNLPSSEAEKTNLRRKFFEIGGFPGVVGCVDGTHIEIKSPGGANAEIFRNRKGFMSLNVQVVAGPTLKIFDIVIRWPGSAHDSRIFNSSAVAMKFESKLLIGILLGDSAYQQNQFLYSPILNPQTPPEQRYNIAHVRTRNVVERTFGVWKGRFRCLTGALQCNIKNVRRIIAATVVLHNIAQDIKEEIPNNNEIPNEERIVPVLPAVDRRRGNIIRNAFIQRHFM
ncbi:putative nuclease HARBI1 [Onthophagus taurus]|uniref:putative nuclease HARBI1 n=1 Tax=Onthophagus taurus TaxID=166361 RepID=UPI0039BEA47E